MVELVNLEVMAAGAVDKPALPELPSGDGDPARALTDMRDMLFEGDGPWTATPVYDGGSCWPATRSPAPR